LNTYIEGSTSGCTAGGKRDELSHPDFSLLVPVKSSASLPPTEASTPIQDVRSPSPTAAIMDDRVAKAGQEPTFPQESAREGEYPNIL
jgi:hypothetical protein